MRICEELIYHSAYNPKYIVELKSELCQKGMIANDVRQVNIKIKEAFKSTVIYKSGKIFLNSREKNTSDKIHFSNKK